MGEFEDNLNRILSSPEDMEKLMGMAKSLSSQMGGGFDGENGAFQKDGGGKTEPSDCVDPKLLAAITRLMGELNSQGSGKGALIDAIKPYLTESRRERIERASKTARLFKAAKTVFSDFSGGDRDF